LPDDAVESALEICVQAEFTLTNFKHSNIVFGKNNLITEQEINQNIGYKL